MCVCGKFIIIIIFLFFAIILYVLFLIDLRVIFQSNSENRKRNLFIFIFIRNMTAHQYWSPQFYWINIFCKNMIRSNRDFFFSSWNEFKLLITCLKYISIYVKINLKLFMWFFDPSHPQNYTYFFIYFFLFDITLLISLYFYTNLQKHKI